MSPKGFAHHDQKKRDTYESLRQEYDYFKGDIERITEMNISDEAKKLPLEELQKQINEIKERMHDYIDTL